MLQQLKLAYEYVDNPVCITDSENIILFINESFLETENEKPDIIGRSSLEIKNLYKYIASPISQNKHISLYLYIQNLNEANNISDYKSLFENTPLPYQSLDKNGIIKNVNKEWLERFKYKKEDVIGKNIASFLTQASQTVLSEKFCTFVSNGRVDDADFDMLSQDDTIIPIRVHGSIQYNELHQPEYTHCILEDISNEQKYKQQFLKSYEETIYSFININEQKDGYTAGHSQRVAFYSSKIAENMGMDMNTINLVYKSGMLHDIGKIIVPESILLKPGSFNELELKLMREHPQSGYDILQPISMYEEIAEIIVHHHEHYDGSGYPSGIKGDEIPLISQILAISDTFDAMTTNRIYKVRKSVRQAMDELKTLSGTWFEPTLLNKAIEFLESLPEVKQVNQLPKTDIEKQRFSYFFKDRLTNVYNGDYLNIHLQENNITQTYQCFNFIKIHNMGQYNTDKGWDKGNQLLKDFSEKLLELTSIENIYRVYGDDFIILNPEHLDIDVDTINNWNIIKDTCLSIELKHYDLKNVEIDSWQELEMSIE
ncbi:HD domain-containing phosphohydrolase [Sulfurimonas sp.]|uniref:HD domain-containing phosphohydrolase n=1 Tax=Sulfurimonas sp. TaxID=2022749 RepID=UPI0039E58B4D